MWKQRLYDIQTGSREAEEQAIELLLPLIDQQLHYCRSSIREDVRQELMLEALLILRKLELHPAPGFILWSAAEKLTCPTALQSR
ncbi:hypothetical protein [Alkalicoccus luteus]|uniref:Helix-turn-helix conjugative transposon-like domain-containing protein n=1 Tax=Alkalicoccus luteus TaxID=1237094 RepID=A0A969PMF6_9BACI|nr:hypothetical protein [Alkalicoccus luteus]NJP36882.1 hypothetical protein [Alkalicoccus luteus]